MSSLTNTHFPFLFTCLALQLAAAPAIAQSTSSTQDMAAANFRSADANGDGALNATEFVTFINLNAAQNIGQARRVKNAGAYDRAFAQLDLNANGLVTAEELRSGGN